MNVDYVVSLGGNCEVAEQIRHHFRIKRAYCFDWWITPFQTVIDLLNCDFSGIFDELTLQGGHGSVKCKRYNMLHHHDFLRDDKGRVETSKIDGQIPELKEKFSFLISRMRADCSEGRKILFIRSWREIVHEPSDYPRHLIRGVPHYDFKSFLDAIEGRFPDADFKCLFVNYGDQTISDSRALFHNIKDFGDIKNWAGSYLGWKEMFDKFDVRLSQKPSDSLG
jgi:hypothetical protein